MRPTVQYLVLGHQSRFGRLPISAPGRHRVSLGRTQTKNKKGQGFSQEEAISYAELHTRQWRLGNKNNYKTQVGRLRGRVSNPTTAFRLVRPVAKYTALIYLLPVGRLRTKELLFSIIKCPTRLNYSRSFAKFCAKNRISFNDPKTTEQFITYVRNAIKNAQSDQILLHGQRTQTMFERLLLSLSSFTLLKYEDMGHVYPKNQFKIPDFRVVLSDGTQWLIEVKNVYEEDPLQQKRKLLNSSYREKLEAYASATGGQLKLAIYWARWSIWTLVSPERLIDTNGDLTLDMETAMRTNELSRLGDMMSRNPTAS